LILPDFSSEAAGRLGERQFLPVGAPGAKQQLRDKNTANSTRIALA
jgi:hypothetical protein